MVFSQSLTLKKKKKKGSVIQSYLILCEVNYDLHFPQEGNRNTGLSNLHKAKHLLSSITETQAHTFFYSIFLNITAYQLVVPRAAVSAPPGNYRFSGPRPD